MIYGMDVLAGAKYAKTVLKHVPAGWALGFFWGTFGSIEGLLHKVAKKKTIPLIGSYKFPLVRVQGIWSDTHTFPTGKAENEAIEIAKRYEKIAAQYPHITWQYSPWCEHREGKARMEMLFTRLKNVAPHLELVNTPINGGSFVDNAINEWHHSNPVPNKGPAQYSYDGVHCVDSDIEAAKKKAQARNAKVFFMWVLQFNLKKNREDKTPRPLRKCYPTKDLIKSIAYLKEIKTPDTLSSKWLWKSHAEQHQDIDNRANKPVMLGPVDGRVEVKSGDKKIVLTPSGIDHHSGDHVYRLLTSYGYQLKRTVEIFVNGKSIGRVDPGFRSSKRYIEQ